MIIKGYFLSGLPYDIRGTGWSILQLIETKYIIYEFT